MNNGGGGRQAWIRHATGYNDVRSGAQRTDDTIDAEVGVRRRQAIAHGRDRRARLQISVSIIGRIPNDRQDVVSINHRDFQSPQAELG